MKIGWSRHTGRPSPMLWPQLKTSSMRLLIGLAAVDSPKPETGKAYLGYRPSKKSIRRMVETISTLTAHSVTWQGTEEVVSQLNRALRGWANCFKVGSVNRA